MVKTLRAFFVRDADAQERFKREYALLESMNHPRIVPTREWGEDPVAGFYYTMPFLAGGTLEDARRNGASIGKLINWWIEIVAAIIHAHDRGLFHRDIKPKNVVVHSDEPTLVDWGIGRDTTGLHTTTFGTHGWAPPEYRAGGATGAFTDVFGLVGLLGWILTDLRPDALNSNVHDHLAAADYPFAALERVLSKGLGDADHRYQTVKALWSDIAPALAAVKRHLLTKATTIEAKIEVFWPRLVQNNTNSLQPKTRIFEFHRPAGRSLLTLSFLSLSQPQKAVVERYLELGLRLALATGRDPDTCQLWRIQTTGGGLMYHEWICGPEGVDLFRVIRALDKLSLEDQGTVFDFLFLAEEYLAERAM